MSVLRSSGLFVVIVVLLAAAAGCGGAAAPSGSTPVGASSTPAPASQSAPASQPAEPTDDGGTGSGSFPPIVDAQYTTGRFHAEISGDVTATIDVPLQGGFSFTAGGSTVLSYADPTTGDGGGVVIAPDVLGITLSTKSISTGGSNADANHCDVAITQSDASRLAGTFDCKRLLSVNPSTSQNITVDMRGSFEAKR